MHSGKNPEDICAEDSKYAASFYTSTPENMAACQARMDAIFKSWDVAAVTLIHFSLLTFITIRVILCLTCGGKNQHRGCNCGHCGHNDSVERAITVDDLRRMIELASITKQRSPLINNAPAS